ncbi:MAG: hypothetical protein ABJE47_03115 [bacterium]
MDNYPRLAPVAYVIAFLLVIVPLFDSIMGVAPLHLGNAQWRFGAFGMLSNSLVFPFVGLLIAVAVSMAFEHEGMQKFLWVTCWLAAVVLVLSVIFFALDSVQTRTHIRADIQTSFEIASWTALVKLFLGAVVFGMMGWAIPGGELFNIPEFHLRRAE